MVDTRTIRYHETPYFVDLEYDEGWDENDTSLEVEILKLQRKYEGSDYFAGSAQGRTVIIAEDKNKTIVGYAMLYQFTLDEVIRNLRWTPVGSPIQFGEILAVNADSSIRTRTNILETLFAKAEALIKLNQVQISNTPEYKDAYSKYATANLSPVWCDGDCLSTDNCVHHPAEEYTRWDNVKEGLLVVKEAVTTRFKKSRNKHQPWTFVVPDDRETTDLSWIANETPHEAMSGAGASGKTVRLTGTGD